MRITDDRTRRHRAGNPPCRRRGSDPAAPRWRPIRAPQIAVYADLIACVAAAAMPRAACAGNVVLFAAATLKSALDATAALYRSEYRSAGHDASVATKPRR